MEYWRIQRRILSFKAALYETEKPGQKGENYGSLVEDLLDALITQSKK